MLFRIPLRVSIVLFFYLTFLASVKLARRKCFTTSACLLRNLHVSSLVHSEWRVYSGYTTFIIITLIVSLYLSYTLDHLKDFKDLFSDHLKNLTTARVLIRENNNNGTERQKRKEGAHQVRRTWKRHEVWNRSMYICVYASL